MYESAALKNFLSAAAAQARATPHAIIHADREELLFLSLLRVLTLICPHFDTFYRPLSLPFYVELKEC